MRAWTSVWRSKFNHGLGIALLHRRAPAWQKDGRKYRKLPQCISKSLSGIWKRLYLCTWLGPPADRSHTSTMGRARRRCELSSLFGIFGLRERRWGAISVRFERQRLHHKVDRHCRKTKHQSIITLWTHLVYGNRVVLVLVRSRPADDADVFNLSISNGLAW